MKNIFLIVLIFLAFFAAWMNQEGREVNPQWQEDKPSSSETTAGQRPPADVVQEPPRELTCQEILAASPFYRADSSQVVVKENELRQEGKTELADTLQTISCVPQGIWVSGRDPAWEASRARQIVEKAKRQGKIPLFVIYDGPEHTKAIWRHVETGKAYEEWIRTFALALGNSEAWIVFEPDALPLTFNYSEEDREIRLQELKNGVRILKEESPNSRVYIDAGHNEWKGEEIVVRYLEEAGIAQANGFALNVSNHQEVSEEIAYGVKIAELIGDTRFIVDTGQAGRKVEGSEWCNAAGRALGRTPTQNTGNVLIDAFVWVKPPGESDGTCNGGPPPGKFWLEYALQLIANS
ncbi:MAG TPA: glycoside hydrolase family 6 protein [Candidatus Paceibacterota bacterium]